MGALHFGHADEFPFHLKVCFDGQVNPYCACAGIVAALHYVPFVDGTLLSDSVVGLEVQCSVFAVGLQIEDVEPNMEGQLLDDV